MKFQRILVLERRVGDGPRPTGSVPSIVAPRETASRLADMHRASLTVARVDPGELGPIAAEHDLVVAAVHRDSLRWPLRYAPAERALVRSCGCPVWIVQPGQGETVRVVVAAIDVSAQAGEGRARRVVRTAAAVASAAGARLIVAHSWSLTGESLIASPSRGGSRRSLERVLQAEEASRRARIDRLLDEEDVAPAPEVLLLHGRTVASLHELAWEREADVLVTGASQRRRGLGLLAFPPTAEELIGRVRASIVVVPIRAAPAARSA